MKALAAAILFLLPLCALAQERKPEAASFDLKAHYTHYEYYIPMRDGARLFTSVYEPKDTSHPYPFLMTRTPYTVSPYGEDHDRRQLGPSEAFDRAGYIFVFQDVRGRYLSGGNFIDMPPQFDQPSSNHEVDESTDMYDTVDWLLKNIPNNNGRVGIWGISYPGFYTSASIINSHPAIKAASPEAPMTNLFMGDDSYHGGAFMLDANFSFYAFFRPRPNNTPAPPSGNFTPFNYGTTDAYDFYLQNYPLSNLENLIKNPLFDDNVNHDTYDSFWQPRDLSQHMKNVKCATLEVGGWFDAEDLSGPVRTFHAIDKFNSGNFNGLVIGPWVHGGWARYEGNHLGRVQFDSNTGDFYREHIIFPFFEQYLKGNGDAKLPKAYVFETGSNVWRQYASWPPKNVESKTLYLHAHGKLSFDPPAAGEQAYDEYTSDPKHPVPFVAYAAEDVPQEYMLSDQRFAAKRPDVVTYMTDPLEEDVTIAGPVSPHLRISSSGTDSDFDVKLIDVYPADYPDQETPEARGQRTDVNMPVEKMGGYQMLVRGEPMRAKFRNSWAKPEPLVPGQVTPLNFDMQDINHTFRRGHRIMIQIQSSWFPLTDLNPQTFMTIPNAKLSDFHAATERIYHSAQAQSGIVVGVLPRPPQ
ncbi:MAG TPA: CocE/NonD family hydrolase [Terriglobales bacterium]|nr:CocE/NonD family hydrolase [Terriglobales bacterium]